MGMAYKSPVDRADAQRRYRKAHPEKMRAARRRFQVQNPESVKASQKRYREKNREKMRTRDRLWAGLPEPTRPAPKGCEKCSRLFAELRTGPCLDHDHKTGKFRGWLCVRCNIGIGALGDDTEGLCEALRYLQNAELLS